jgi:hypothetical protein
MILPGKESLHLKLKHLRAATKTADVLPSSVLRLLTAELPASHSALSPIIVMRSQRDRATLPPLTAH